MPTVTLILIWQLAIRMLSRERIRASSRNRRERTIELVMEGLRQWDLFRWKEGKQMFNHYVPYYGIYVPGVGTYRYGW